MNLQMLQTRSSLYRAIPIIAIFAVGNALADEPIVDITSPGTGDTIFCESFPCPTPVDVDVEIIHTELRNLNVFKVEVNGESILLSGNDFKDQVGNPFRNAPASSANTCSDDLNAVTTSCSTNGPTPGDSAQITVPWTPGGAGSYTLVASVKHTNEVGEDEETVLVATLSAEYPAPPAEANRHLNDTYTKRQLSGRVRGCIVQQIAQNHAGEAYGPKGGPYDIPQIKVDADAFFYGCQ